MVEQLTPKGWAQLGGSYRIPVSPHLQNTSSIRLVVRLSSGSHGLRMSSIEALQVPSSIEHGWQCVNAMVSW